MMKKLLLLLIFQSLFSYSWAQDFDALDQKIQKAVGDFELPGLAISLVKDGQVDFQKAYGLANQKTGEKLSTEYTFGIASLSKAFTATSIAMLVDEGKLNWSDRVSQYIPAFQLSDPYVASQLTIEDLLCHRSGFNTFDGDLLWYGTNYSRAEIISRFSKYPMEYDFRTQYGYQNIMFIIAGEVLEVVSGKSWESFIEDRIFKPLEMNNSFTSIQQFNQKTKLAMPHVKGELDEVRNYDNSGGAAALCSNVEDLSKWIMLWLNDGIYKGDTLLSKASYQKILDLHTPISPSSFDRSNGMNFKGYGLGWFLMDFENLKVAHHGGGLPGYISKIFIVPSEKMGGIVLSNGETSLPTVLMYESIESYLGIEGNDWPALYLNYTKRYEAYLEGKEKERVAARNPKLKSNIEMADLLGSYEDKVYGKAEVSQVNNQLMLSFLPAKEIFSSKMTHWQQNTYRIQFKDKFLPAGYITFSTNADGEVTGFKVDLPNPDFHFYNLEFIKLD